MRSGLMSQTLTSREVIERAGISRATLNNFIALGISLRPENKTTAGIRAVAPNWALPRIRLGRHRAG